MKRGKLYSYLPYVARLPLVYGSVNDKCVVDVYEEGQPLFPGHLLRVNSLELKGHLLVVLKAREWTQCTPGALVGGPVRSRRTFPSPYRDSSSTNSGLLSINNAQK